MLPSNCNFLALVLGFGAYFVPGFGMSGFPGEGFTFMLLSGILSRPWSPFASLPPDVDVPLPLLLGLIPVVLGFAFCELAAGSPVTAPCPLGFPFCANETVLMKAKQAARPIADNFMVSLRRP
jgi:hypothetical protein